MLFEGDILITRGELLEMQASRASRSKRNAGSGMGEIVPDHTETINHLWPNCRVPYKFEQTMSKCLYL